MTNQMRWRVGNKLGRTLYRNDQIVGMVDSKELATEIVDALNGAAPNDREALAKGLSREANRIFNKQERDYPSNVLDVVAYWIRSGATENFTVHPGDGFPKGKHVTEQDAGLFLRAATSFTFRHPTSRVGDYVLVEYNDEDDTWWTTQYTTGRRSAEPRTFETQAEALAEARRLTDLPIK